MTASRHRLLLVVELVHPLDQSAQNGAEAVLRSLGETLIEIVPDMLKQELTAHEDCFTPDTSPIGNIYARQKHRAVPDELLAVAEARFLPQH
ncbi:MAG TPA: hypothetical protein VGC80_04215 [Acetobacteraceae bacterium]